MAEDWAEKILNYKYIEKEMECKIVTAIHNKTETETETKTETNIETEGNELPKYFDIIKNLFIKYESSAYMRQRLSFHLTNILPSTLETEEKTHEKRVERTAFLTKEQQTFMQVFLSKNQYQSSSSSSYSSKKDYEVNKSGPVWDSILSRPN